MKIDSPSRFTGDGGTHDIAEAHHEGPFLVRLAHRSQGVRSLTGLGNGHHKIAVAQNWIPVAELSGLLDLGMDVCQILKGIFPDKSGVERGSASDQDDPGKLGKFARRGSHACQNR
jgi:hypothetical protein